jgi:hypothetical protein
MPQRYCHHTNPAGVLCQGPPLKHRDYCYWHQQEAGRRMKAARARARGERVILHFSALDDLHAVQAGVTQVLEALAHSEIDPRTAQLMLSALRLAASNLKSDRGWHQKSDLMAFGFEPTMVVADPEFEARYGLPKDFDLSVEPEVAFPAPQNQPRGNRGVRDLPLGGNLGDDDEAPVPWVTADQVELMAIRENEGEAAARKFADQLVRKDHRREHRRERARYEEMARQHTIKFAARKLFEDELRAGHLTLDMTPKQAWEALSQSPAERTRKPPQPQEIAPEGQAAAAAGGD